MTNPNKEGYQDLETMLASERIAFDNHDEALKGILKKLTPASLLALSLNHHIEDVATAPKFRAKKRDTQIMELEYRFDLAREEAVKLWTQQQKSWDAK